MLDPILHNTVSADRCSSRLGQVQRDPGRGRGRARRPPAARLRARGPASASCGAGSATGSSSRSSSHDPGPPAPDMALFAMLGGDPRARRTPAAPRSPLLMPGVSDGRFFAPPRHPDLRVPPMRLPRGLQLLGRRARRGRAHPRGRRRVRRARDRPGAAPVREARERRAAAHALGADAAVRVRAAARAPGADRGRRGGRLRRSVERRDLRHRRLHAARAGGRVDRAHAARHRRRERVHARARRCWPSTRPRSRTPAAGASASGIGSSSNVIVERWNQIPFEKPLTKVRETVEVLRTVLAGRARARRLQARDGARPSAADLHRGAARADAAAGRRAGRRHVRQLPAAVGRRAR